MRVDIAVRDVVTLTYEGEAVPLVVREGSTLVEEARAWCHAHRPADLAACARALNLLAAAQAGRSRARDPGAARRARER